ncbi:hypothetical protein A165_25270 [Vibrio tasmaniensis ZS-17]|uniref:hypothetical protein n=1 Tax=Vibrio TaxID=662 RepID=UPI0002DB4ACE|nr:MULTISPECIES: hypothetical protein [Vibrio]MCC5516663.1 hypothetical protein [Vibrio splendidus]OED60262.1 hypothetical protein A165_25270 [Vibrio tasmaniensis ZS-17]PTO79577.1 hypothetical protein CWN84_02325 [Vibrio splendidus]
MKIQPSTIKGLTLLLSTVAAFFGYGNLFSAEITDQGLELGGVIGAAVPVAVGVYEVVRDEVKGAHKLLERDGDERITTISK